MLVNVEKLNTNQKLRQFDFRVKVAPYCSTTAHFKRCKFYFEANFKVKFYAAATGWWIFADKSASSVQTMCNHIHFC